MVSLNYYYLSFLPRLSELGAPVALHGSELIELLREGGERTRACRLVETIILSDDLLQRDSFTAGQIDETDTSVLTAAQASGEAPLPEYIFQSSAQLNEDTAASVDMTWEAYFRSADQTGRALNSPFLRDWVGYEVALRNGMAERRAQDLGLEGGSFALAPELARGEVIRDIAEWVTAASDNPLSGQRALDRARWRWLDENTGHYSFKDDEIAAYAARLVLARRWARINEEIESVNSRESDRKEQ